MRFALQRFPAIMQHPGLLATALCLINVVNGQLYTAHTQRLRYELFAGYDKNTLPDESTPVNFRLQIKHFDMVEESHAMTLDAWMILEWLDPRLRWLPDDYYGITKLTIPHTFLWKPDLDIYNSAKPEKAISYGSPLAIVYSTGKVLFVPPVKLHFTCVMDLTDWPHDVHNCTGHYGSWVHDGVVINLQVLDDKPQMDIPILETKDGQNLTRGSWKLIESKITRDFKTFNCCEEPYVTIGINMVVERDAPAYTWIIKGPVIGLSILTLVLFILPPAAGEKMTFGVLCLLLDLVFVAYSSHIVAMSPSHLPSIVKLICKQAMLVIASLVVGAFSMRLARDPHTTGLSPFVRRPLMLMASCICLQNYKNLVGFTIWEVSRVQHQTYGRTLRSDEFELKENGNGNGHVYSGEVSASPALDWLLLAAVIDRICLIVYLAIFIFNIVAYSNVL